MKYTIFPWIHQCESAYLRVTARLLGWLWFSTSIFVLKKNTWTIWLESISVWKFEALFGDLVPGGACAICFIQSHGLLSKRHMHHPLIQEYSQGNMWISNPAVLTEDLTGNTISQIPTTPNNKRNPRFWFVGVFCWDFCKQLNHTTPRSLT